MEKTKTRENAAIRIPASNILSEDSFKARVMQRFGDARIEERMGIIRAVNLYPGSKASIEWNPRKNKIILRKPEQFLPENSDKEKGIEVAKTFDLDGIVDKIEKGIIKVK